MTKLSEINPQGNKTQKSGVKEKIFQYVDQRKDEVFPYSYNSDADVNLKAAFPEIDAETIDAYLYQLVKEGRLEKINIGKRVYIGSNEAVSELRKKTANENKQTQ